MQPRTFIVYVALFLLIALPLAGCGADGGAAAPTASQVTAPTSASAPTAAPPTAVPPTAVPTLAPTAAPEPTAEPTADVGAAPAAGELTDEEVLKALNVTFASFPRRQRMTVTLKKDNSTSKAVAELESADRIHGSQEIRGQVYEAVVISPTVYLKTPQGWQKQNDPSMLQLFTLVANPGAFLKSSGFQELFAALKKNKSAYKLIGTEQIGGIQAQIYQYEVHSPVINATYTFWLGADGRIYKMESESDRLKSSTFMEFDPSIKVEPPAV
jgi:hypothetical protein